MTRLVGLTVGDRPEDWVALGFTVSGDRFTVGGVTIQLVGDAGPRGLVAWSLDPSTEATVDGLAHRPAPVPAAPAVHGNGVTAVDHVVVGTPHVDRTTQALGEIGCTPRRTVEGIRGRGSTYRFFLLETCVLEVIGPTEHDPMRTPRPAAFVGLAFVAPTLDAVTGLGDVADEPHDAVQPGRRIVTLRIREHGVSVPLAVLTPRRPRTEDSMQVDSIHDE